MTCLRLDRRLLRSLDGLVFEGDDEIDSLADEHLRLVLGLRLVQISPHEPEALALEVAALSLLLQAALDDEIREIPPECLLELQGQAVEGARDVIQTDVHEADARCVLRGRPLVVRARPGGQRARHEHGAAERRERDD